MKKPHIEIRTKENTSGIFTEIVIDGHILRGVRSWELSSNGNNAMPTLTLDLNALDLTVDGEFVTRQKGYEEIEINFKHEVEGEQSPSLG